MERIPAAGTELESDKDTEPGPSKKRIKRRTREEGVEGGAEFKDWGSRKMLLFAVVHKIPESY